MKKHFKAVELKHLDNATIMKIREWRNQPFVRSMMFSQHEITEEEHMNYIAALKQDDNRGLFVFYLDDEPFGVFQYKLLREKNAIVPGTYLISQDYQVMGYGVIMDYMVQLITYHYLDADVIYAEVLRTNREQVKLHKVYGGVLISKNKYYGDAENVNADINVYMYPVQVPDKRFRFSRIVIEMIEILPIEDMVWI